jgi:malate dehydrogenase (oxaloacetate-decarboxylating)
LISFNDDIQGTGAIAFAAILSAMKINNEKLADQRILIHGGGAGGVGIGEQIMSGMIEEGLSEQEALERIFMIDSNGLIVSPNKVGLYKKKFAKDQVSHPWIGEIDKIDIPGIIRKAGITTLVGTTGQDFFFNEEVIREIKKNSKRPLILPLFQHISTPQVFCQNISKWSEEGLLVATGNPCATGDMPETACHIGQCNNGFVFPGIGLGVLASGASEVLPEFFTVAARAISDMMPTEQLEQGRLVPPINDIRKVAKKVALVVAMCAVKNGVSRPCVYSDFQHNNDEARMRKIIDRIRWNPEYLPLVSM